MRISVLLTVVFSALVFVACCGKEQGRVAFAGPGTASKSMTLEAGEVAFWTDIDIDWEGPASLGYSVRLEQGGTVVATAKCDPLANLNVKTRWVETNLGDKHSRSGNGKMHCTASVPKAGATNVAAELAFGKHPAKVNLTKADLVVKQ